MIEMRETTETSKFYDPSSDEVKQEKIVIRKDPLTGKQSRIVQKSLPLSKNSDLPEEVLEGFCPFCEDKIYDIGARESQVLDNDLLKNEEAVLLANISPYAEHSLVIRLTEEHYLPLDRFKPKHFTDAFELILKYLKKKPHDLHAAVMMNYLKPAGSSVVHPHLQVLITRSPMNHHKNIIEASKDYHKIHGTNYWEDLLKQEKKTERFIGIIGESHWISPFAPRGLEHIQGVSLKDFRSMDRDELQDISKGIVNTLRYYANQGLNSFNYSILFSHEGYTDITIIDIVARSTMDKYYWCDVFALSKLIDEYYSNKYPKKIAKDAREFF